MPKISYESPVACKLNGNDVIRFKNWTTLPITYCQAIVTQTIRAFGKGSAKLIYVPHEYLIPDYQYTDDHLRAASRDCSFATLAVNAWRTHQMQFGYYIQFETDVDGLRAGRFADHTKLAAAIIDSRTTLSSDLLWEVRDALLACRFVQMDYRNDTLRDAKYLEYAKQLETASTILKERSPRVRTLIERVVQQLELKSTTWPSLAPLYSEKDNQVKHSQPLKFFISYSHADEAFMESLMNHISAMKRQGLVSEWHDRCITGGQEWEGQIDINLETASVILLLVSSDFIASNYCYDVELKRAIQRHSEGSARVIPIFIRPCDWNELPFAKLQGLPKDGRPVAKWENPDDAFTDIAKGLRRVTNELLGTT